MNQASLQQSAPRYITLLLAVLALAIIAFRGYDFWQDFQEMNKAVSVKAVAATDQSTERPISSVVSLNLFGKKEDKADPIAEVTEDLPETNLKLVLRGVGATEIDKTGGALVEGPDRQTEFFRIGEDMPGNAVLHSVFANRVVIDRKGKLENLFFPESRSDNSSGFQTFDEPDRGIEESYEEPTYPEPEYVEPEYPEPQYVEPEYDSPDASSEPGDDEQNQALNGLDEQRREEIRNRLQQLREQIKNQNEG